MERIEIAKPINEHKKLIDQISKLINEIARLDQNRDRNIYKIKDKVTRVKSILDELEKEADLALKVYEWAKEYSAIIQDSENEIKKRFGVELEKLLAERGFKLGGHYPDLQTSFFTLELDFAQGKVKIWYGPKQELLSQCGLSVEEVTTHIEKVNKHLGSGLSDEEFLEKLNQAIYRVVGNKIGESAQIVTVLKEIALLIQSPRFQQDPKREHYKSYCRADFSYDLYQLRQSGSLLKSGKVPQLVVATRAHTNSRRDYIWIPDDAYGRGSTYSHIKIKRG